VHRIWLDRLKDGLSLMLGFTPPANGAGRSQPHLAVDLKNVDHYKAGTI